MIKDYEEIYYYGSIKDFLVNYLEAGKVFREVTDRNPLESSIEEIIDELNAEDEVDAVEKILDHLDDHYIVTRDSNEKIEIIKLNSVSVRSLDYYMQPENMKKIRKEMGYTQKDFGTKMGFDSVRRGVTILEKEKGKAPITPRDARLLRYMVTYGVLE
ncbi:MAG TPA: helix-turn-helix transcriptional regulator [bacterium]|nr:helix-turn-helix transcriptional regulator [bacterium]